MIDFYLLEMNNVQDGCNIMAIGCIESLDLGNYK
ncbi:MAG: hypothetical protein RLY16_1949, partial [Bacteroidota bacterium]